MSTYLIRILVILVTALVVVGVRSLWITKTKPEKELPASMRGPEERP
jgi:hypothetical protein